MTRLEAALLERMSVRRWLVVVGLAVLLGAVAAGSICEVVGYRHGRRDAAADLAATARDASAMLADNPIAGAAISSGLARARLSADRIADASELKRIGLALIMHGNEHGGHGPKALSELDVFQGDSPPSPLPGCSFVYRGWDSRMPDKTIVLYESGDDQFCNALFADGHVEAFYGNNAMEVQRNGQRVLPARD